MHATDGLRCHKHSQKFISSESREFLSANLVFEILKYVLSAIFSAICIFVDQEKSFFNLIE